MPNFSLRNISAILVFLAIEISLYSTPPPPCISSHNVSIPESAWDGSTTVYVSGTEGLHGYPDAVKGITLSRSDFYLNGYTLKVGVGGITAGGGPVNIWGGGGTTAIGDTVKFYAKSGAENALRIEGGILNNLQGKVGILVRNNSTYGFGIVRISGAYHNNFTGDTVIDGESSHLYLAKRPGAVAIRGNIYARNGGIVGLERSNQIVDTATVTLQGRHSAFSLNDMREHIYEKIHALVVEGEGQVIFGRPSGQLYQKTLILDDLIIKDGASLGVIGWRNDLDLFLIKKNGRSEWEMQALLNKIHFDGPNRQKVELRNYDGISWKLYASPEPGTYGVIFCAVGLLCVGAKKARARKHAP